jgi:hypothetical protein
LLSLQAVFYFVFCHPASPDTFEIATNFPKRVLNCAPQGEGSHIQTFKEAGLRCREVLFVYDLEAWYVLLLNLHRMAEVKVFSVWRLDHISVMRKRITNIASLCFHLYYDRYTKYVTVSMMEEIFIVPITKMD